MLMAARLLSHGSKPKRRKSTMRIHQHLGSGLAFGLLLWGGSVQADMLGGLGAWHGSGARFDAEGRKTADFQVELTRTADGPNSVKTRGKVVMASGQVVPFESRWTR